MKVTSPWMRVSLSLCLAAGWMIQPIVAEDIIPVPVPSAEPIAAEPISAVPPEAEPVAGEPTPAQAEVVAEPLQAVELAPPLAAPPSSRLSKVRITDESPNAPAEQATEPTPAAKSDDDDIVTELVK